MFDWLGELFSIAMTAVYQGNAAAMVSLLSLVALTEAGIPLPFILDSVLFFTSYKNGPLSIQVLIVLLTVFIGRQFGANVIYWLTRFLGNAFISWLGKRYRSLQNNLDRLEARLSNHAVPAVIVTRLTGLLTLASVASGAVCMRYHYFIVGVALSALIFDGVLILLGFITRNGLDLLGFTPSTWQVIVGLVIIISLVWVIFHLVLRRIFR